MEHGIYMLFTDQILFDFRLFVGTVNAYLMGHDTIEIEIEIHRSILVHTHTHRIYVYR